MASRETNDDGFSLSRSSSASYSMTSPAVSPRASVNSRTPVISQHSINLPSEFTPTPPLTPSRPGYSAPISASSYQPQASIQVRRRAPSPDSFHPARYSSLPQYDEFKDKPIRGKRKTGIKRMLIYAFMVIAVFLIIYGVGRLLFWGSKADDDGVPASKLEIELANVKEELVRANNVVTGLRQALESPVVNQVLNKRIMSQAVQINSLSNEKFNMERKITSLLDQIQTVSASLEYDNQKKQAIATATSAALVVSSPNVIAGFDIVQESPKKEETEANDVQIASEINLSHEQHAELVRQDPEAEIKLEQQKVETNDKEKDEMQKNMKKIVPITTMKLLPASSVWCEGPDKIHRVCKFRNLCYHPKHESWFIAKTAESVISGVPHDRWKESLLELGTVAEHPYFNWNYEDVNPYDPDFQNLPVRYETLPHFLFLRLHPRNIMHNLHDDIIPMYHHLKRWVGKGSTPSSPFDLDGHRMLMMDKYGKTDSSRPFDYLSNHPMRLLRDLHKDDAITCFRDATVGNSKLTTWYQYGFRIPQGPIPGKSVNGLWIREVATWIVKRVGMPLTADELPEYDLFVSPGKTPASNNIPIDNMAVLGTDSLNSNKNLDPEDTNLIVILSRKKNRLILNENELAAHLTKTFGYETIFVRNEDHSFEEQVKLLRRARVVIGMHGSILVMGMFCKRGTVLVEMYPFAVPGKNYTPYKTMAELPGMGLIYKTWENKWENASVAHPNNTKLFGGISYLSSEKQEKVKETKTVPTHLCCADPYWLYRIYQDTHVHLDEISAVIKSGIEEARELKKKHLSSRKSIQRYLQTQVDASEYINKKREEMKPAKNKTSSLENPFLASEIAFNMPENLTDEFTFATKLPLFPPTIKKAECLDGKLRKPGDLWIEWARPWNHANVDYYRVFISNTKKEFRVDPNARTIDPSTVLGDNFSVKDGEIPKLQWPTVSMSLGGFPAGEILTVYIRPVLNGMRGEAIKIECKV